jgi:osmoprotectant transport system substrate-binding protein
VRRPLLSFLILMVGVLALAACGSSSDSSSSSGSSSSSSLPSGQPGKGKPSVTLGDKNFTEEYILGELYKQALEAKGYTIKLKSNIGSSEITDKALTSGKIDMYPEYAGVITGELKGSDQHPKSAEQNYNEAKKWEESRGFTLTEPTPFEDKDVLATKKDFASENSLKSIEDLKKLKTWSLGGPPENKTRYQGVVGLHEAYGLNNLTFKPLTIGLQYQALDQGKVDVATVFSTDGKLAKGQYALLDDPKGIFGYQNVAMVLKPSLLKAQGPAFEQTINAVSAKLTNDAMQQMNAAVDLNKLQPKDVASKFLQANGLSG